MKRNFKIGDKVTFDTEVPYWEEAHQKAYYGRITNINRSIIYADWYHRSSHTFIGNLSYSNSDLISENKWENICI